MKRHIRIFDGEKGGVYVEDDNDNDKGNPIIYLCANHDVCIPAGVRDIHPPVFNRRRGNARSQFVGLPIKEASKHFNVSCSTKTGSHLMNVKVGTPTL